MLITQPTARSGYLVSVALTSATPTIRLALAETAAELRAHRHVPVILLQRALAALGHSRLSRMKLRCAACGHRT